MAPIYTIWPKCKNHFLPLFHLILKFPRPSLPVVFSMDWAVGVVNELNRKLLDYPQAESKENIWICLGVSLKWWNLNARDLTSSLQTISTVSCTCWGCWNIPSAGLLSNLQKGFWTVLGPSEKQCSSILPHLSMSWLLVTMVMSTLWTEIICYFTEKSKHSFVLYQEWWAEPIMEYIYKHVTVCVSWIWIARF